MLPNDDDMNIYGSLFKKKNTYFILLIIGQRRIGIQIKPRHHSMLLPKKAKYPPTTIINHSSQMSDIITVAHARASSNFPPRKTLLSQIRPRRDASRMQTDEGTTFGT